MKKIFLIFPLAVMLANCSSTRSTTSTSASTGVDNASQPNTGAGVNNGVSGTDTTSVASAKASTSPSSASGTSSAGSTDTSSTGGNTNTGSTAAPGTNVNSDTTSGRMSGSSSGKSTNAGTMSNGTTTASGTNANSDSTPGRISTSSSSKSTNAGTMSNGSTANNTTSYNNSTPGRTSSAGMSDDVFDPNNYMQNPDRYLRPDQLTKTGGWTYNKDWRRNTNFAPEAVGQWQLVLTPEVTSNWKTDTSKPESYASFWTPEAVMNRQQIAMVAAAKAMDSAATVNNAMAADQTAKPGRKGGKKSSLVGNKITQTGRSTASSTGVRGKMRNEVSGTDIKSENSAVNAGSGTTGTMGTGGLATDSTNSNAATDSAGMANSTASARSPLMAVNGNNYMMPMVNLFIGNGSFTAYTGCNNALGTLTVNGNSLHFQDPAPSTNIACTGGFDQAAFIDRLHRADSYDMVNNQIRLKQGDQVLMVFSKNGQ